MSLPAAAYIYIYCFRIIASHCIKSIVAIRSLMPKIYYSRHLSLLLLPFSFFAANALLPSLKASTDLICHTNHASECYPRTFQPTFKFQTVHDDQTLPPGLHIRINLATGVKEAKLNEPDQLESSSSADIVAVVDEFEKAPTLRDQSNSREILNYRPKQIDSSEGALFASALNNIKSSSTKPSLIISELLTLQELVHAYHWGLTLSRDEELVSILIQNVSNAASVNIDIRSAATLLLATAIHNNPDALATVLSCVDKNRCTEDPLEAAMSALTLEEPPVLLTRMVFLISALCKDQLQKQKFVDNHGLNLLAEVFETVSVGKVGRDKLQGKIANFVLDHLLLDDALERISFPAPEATQNMVNSQDFGPINEDQLMVVEEAENKTTSSIKLKTGNAQNKIMHNLRPWCFLFDQSITRLASSEGRNIEAARALESIQDAYKTLNERLGLVNCDHSEA